MEVLPRGRDEDHDLFGDTGAGQPEVCHLAFNGKEGYMSRATATMRGLAEQLIGFETRGKATVPEKKAAAAAVCEKLRPVLATLIGNGGFRGLLSRALVLATAEAPWMKGAHISEEGTLEGLDAVAAQADARKVVEGSVEMIAQLLSLLTAFIGHELTVRFLREAWPKVIFKDSKSNSGGEK